MSRTRGKEPFYGYSGFWEVSVFVCVQSNADSNEKASRHARVDIIAENVYFGDSKKDSETSDNASAPTTGYATAPSQNSDFANVGEEDGELPF